MGVSTSPCCLEIRQAWHPPVSRAAHPCKLSRSSFVSSLPRLATPCTDLVLVPRPLPGFHHVSATEEEEREVARPGWTPTGLEPVLKRSTVINQEGLYVRPALATDSNEWKAPAVRSASWLVDDMSATGMPIYLHALFSGLIPPFSPFLNAIISHYQIHLMHLDPRSIILLAVFAFLCEAMVGIVPSVALFCHFFLLRLVDARQCLGCAIFEAVVAIAGSGIDFELSPTVKGFRNQWLFVDAGTRSPLLLTPQAPATPSFGWVM